jgi:hypothetical protein
MIAGRKLFQKSNLFTLCVSILFIYYYTKFYYNYFFNYNNEFHVNTFGIDLYDNPCEMMDTKRFRININDPDHPSYTKCISNMCTNGQFIGAQIRMPTKLAYDVEHIIDNNGPEYENCNKNIVANYVMAKNEWNQMLGIIARFDYTKATNIKSQVYGKKMMKRVRLAIEKCCAPIN